MKIDSKVWEMLRNSLENLGWDYDRMSTSGQQFYDEAMDIIYAIEGFKKGE